MYAKDHVFPDPYGRVTTADLTISGGASKALELFVPDRGVITRAIVSQIGGALESFTYTVYNSKNAFVALGANPTLAANETRYRIIGPVVVASSKKIYDGGGVWPNDGVHTLFLPYRNNDGNATIGSNALYLHILAGGSGSKVFDVALTIAPPQYDL